MRHIALAVCLAVPLANPGAVAALTTSAGTVSVEEMLTGLETPWGMDFLPGGAMLVTERAGRLLHFDKDGDRTEVSGAPEVFARGQGGLLDVLVPRDFEQSREVFLTFSRAQARGAGTALASGRLSDDGARLENVRILFEAAAGSGGGRHFGSRLAESPDGHIFLTIGDRGDRPSAQDRENHNGTVIRLNRDGTVPEDNPFVGMDGVRPEIFSYGHRNPQGAAMDADGRLWISEHGARGGDEVNLIRAGANYGWPVISYGRHYSGLKIGEGTEKDGMEQPAHYWDPSIAPAGMMVYSGALFADWAGDLFVTSLKFGLISRLETEGGGLAEAEQIEGPETARVRDIAEAPDGSIWFLSEGNGAAYRMTP